MSSLQYCGKVTDCGRLWYPWSLLGWMNSNRVKERCTFHFRISIYERIFTTAKMMAEV